MWGKILCFQWLCFLQILKCVCFVRLHVGLAAAPGTLRMKTTMLRPQQCYEGKTSHSWLPISQPISACQTWCKDGSHQHDREIAVSFMERRHNCPPWPRHYAGTLFEHAYRRISHLKWSPTKNTQKVTKTTWSILTSDD